MSYTVSNVIVKFKCNYAIKLSCYSIYEWKFSRELVAKCDRFQKL